MDINAEVLFLLSANYHKEKEILATKQIDLAIIDLQMPEKNGADLMVDMKSVNITAGIPIIVIIAAGQEPLLRTSIELIVDYYLRKPVNRSVLEGVVKGFICE